MYKRNRIISIFTIFTLIISLFCAAPFSAYADENSISWDGNTYSEIPAEGLTIDGSSDVNNPTVVTVKGNIEANGILTINSGYVLITGGTVTINSNAVPTVINAGAIVTFKDVKYTSSNDVYPYFLYVEGEADIQSGTVFENGSFLEGNDSMISIGSGGVVNIFDGEFTTMNTSTFAFLESSSSQLKIYGGFFKYGLRFIDTWDDDNKLVITPHSNVSINPFDEFSVMDSYLASITISQDENYEITSCVYNGNEVSDISSFSSNGTDFRSLEIQAGPAGGSSESDYSAYFQTDAEEVDAGGTFTADLYMKANSAFSAGQIAYSVTKGTVTDVTFADGFSADQSASSDGIISFFGSDISSASDGVKIATLTVQADENLTSADSVTLEINAEESYAAASGNSADLDVTAGDILSVPVAANRFEKSDYAPGVTLVKYTGEVADGGIVTFDSNEMMYSKQLNSFIYLVDSAAADTIKNSDFDVVSGTKTLVDYSGDVNGNQAVNIVDAQIAYDMGKGVYTLTEELIPMWYRADVNTNCFADALDARSIQMKIHGLS